MRRFCETQGQNKGIKDFITVLLLYREYRADELEAAVEAALDMPISSSDGVKHLRRYSGPEVTVAPLAQWSSLPSPDVSLYGQRHAGTEMAAGTAFEGDVEGGMLFRSGPGGER